MARKPQRWGPTATSYSDEECVRVLRCLQEYREKNGTNPTLREMMVTLELSSSSVMQRRIDALLARGWVVTTEGKARSVRPTMAGLQAAQLTNNRCWACGGRMSRCAHDQKEEAR